MLAAGQELSTFDGFWMQRCGLNKGANIAHTHRNVLSTLSLLQGFDQVDMRNLAGVEFLSKVGLDAARGSTQEPKAAELRGP